MSEAELRGRVRAKIGEICSVPAAQVDSAMSLTGELPFDSLQLFELAAALEDEFGMPELDEAAVASIETVGDVERCVVEGLAADSLAGGG